MICKEFHHRKKRLKYQPLFYCRNTCTDGYIYNLQNLLTHYNINLLFNKLENKNSNQGRLFCYTRARPRETHRRAHAINSKISNQVGNKI